jgi:hypothetical protein
MKVFKFSALSVFAEDIREEVAGTQTIVGVMPDNMAVPSFPGLFPKIAVYTRISFDPGFPPKNLSIACTLNDTLELAADTFATEMIEGSVRATRAKDGPIATLVSKILIGGITISGPSRIRVVVSNASGDVLAGSLNIELVEA